LTDARELYRRAARSYDRRATVTTIAPVQRRAVAALGAQPGDCVLEVACGTGLNFEAMEARIGARGRLIGVDLSPEMLQVARARVERHGWTNVSLIEARAEDFASPVIADGALLSFTHDVLRSPDAIANVVGALRGGGRVVACGVKQPPLGPLGAPLVRAVSRRYVTNLTGLREPWGLLAQELDGVRVESMFAGLMYVFSGHRRPDAA